MKINDNIQPFIDSFYVCFFIKLLLKFWTWLEYIFVHFSQIIHDQNLMRLLMEISLSKLIFQNIWVKEQFFFYFYLRFTFFHNINMWQNIVRNFNQVIFKIILIGYLKKLKDENSLCINDNYPSPIFREYSKGRRMHHPKGNDKTNNDRNIWTMLNIS